MTKKAKATTNKRELVEAVRALNPAGLNTAGQIFWDVEGALKTTTMDDSGVQQQIVIVENGVNYSVKKFNDLKVAGERLTRTLKSRLDELDDQKKGFETLDAMKNATTEEGLKIKSLQRETKELRAEIERKEHYTRVLENMLLRLKHNALKFDAHMTGMEETHRNIHKEGAEIRLLRRNLDAGLAKAVAVLDETKEFLDAARTDRKVLLEQRRNELRTAQTLQEWMSDRETQKQALATELKGDLTKVEENFLKRQLSSKVETTKSLQKATEESHKRLQAMEDAFLQLKQVTGVGSVDEMYEKFNNQTLSKKVLEMDVADAAQSLEKAKKEYAKKEQYFHSLKVSGGGMSELSREATQAQQEAIEKKKSGQKLIRADTERLSGLLLQLEQGSAGLMQRVNPHMHLAEGNVFELTEAEDKANWIVAMDALSTAEQVLAKMMEAMAGDGTGSPTQMKNLLDAEEDDDSDDGRSVGTVVEAPVFGKNVRIKSKKMKRESEEEKDEKPPMTEGGKRPMHPSMHGGADGDGSVESISRHRSSNKTGEEEEKAPATRNQVKNQSANRANAHNRKLEAAERRKLLKETLASQNSDDAALALKAKLMQQKAMGQRLSTFPAPVTLPEGVTLRDDPMTKTKAFLSKMPKLV
jgi:hypothetical protein